MNGSADKQVVVIGGGFGGLSAAARMAAKGYPVTLLEKRHQLGGRAGVFTEKGYTFDTGPTIMTPPFLIDDVFRTAGREPTDYVQLVEISPKYRLYFPDGTQMDYGSSKDNLREVERLSSEDVKGYQNFIKAVKPIYELGFEKFGFMPFESLLDMVKVGHAGIKYKAYRSVHGIVSTYVKDPRLRMALSFNPLFIGGNPFTATGIYTLITYIEEKHGMWWVKGGTHKLVDALERLIAELGGQIHLNSDVGSIDVKNNRVRGVTTTEGNFYDADIVISNADIAHTYTKLIGSEYRKKNTDKRYRKAKYSMSLFMTYFGVKKKYEDMTHHSIIFGPRYKGLIDDIFQHNRVPDDFSTYIHMPTITDPELAPEGCETVYACTPVSNLDSGTDWDKEKEGFKDHILSTLDSSLLPGLLDNLEVTRVFTPADFEQEFHAYKGNAFQLQPLLLQSGYFRPQNRSPDVKGLYMVGAGTHPGAGVPSVLMSADLTTRLIFEDVQNKKI